MSVYEGFYAELDRIRPFRSYGCVETVVGSLCEVRGLNRIVTLGARCTIYARDRREIPAEVVGFKGKNTLLLPYATLEGVGPGCRVDFISSESFLYPDLSWLGRVINGQGEAVDDREPLRFGPRAYPVKGSPPEAHRRKAVEQRLDLGVRAINSFVTCCRGQRMGIFAGSGVGKSLLLAQLSRYTEADVVVIGLVGERGREVTEFIEKHLGEEGMQKAVVVVATSDTPALMRRQAAYTTLAIAEYFRDQGKEVLCLIDSVTRFAMALREIGLAAGEPPATKGYTPMVFAELPRLLERAGPGLRGEKSGNITGLFTVLVEGDDHNEIISDTVRGILDGHIVLDRKIAERGRFPAINILRSLSRMIPQCHSEEESQLTAQARKYLAIYDDMAEMIRLGAYRKGTNKEIDEAIFYHDKFETFLGQKLTEQSSFDDCFEQLSAILKTHEKAA